MPFKSCITSLLVLFSCAVLTACATPGPVAQAPSVERANLDQLPVPDRPYDLEPFDVLEIKVFGQPDLTRKVEIDEDGTFQFPFVGAVQAANTTPAKIETEIEQGLEYRYVRNPQVSVTVEVSPSRQLFVGGQVNRPGQYPVQGNLSLMQSVMLAGGTTEFSKLDDVLVMRDVNGTRWLGLYNLGGIQRGNYSDPQLYPGDTVVVGDSPGRRQLLRILQYVPLFTQPLIAYNRIAN